MDWIQSLCKIRNSFAFQQGREIEKMNEYELRCQKKIKQNQALLAELDITSIIPKAQRQGSSRPPAKKRKVLSESTPSRSSARIRAAPAKPNYNEDDRSGAQATVQPRRNQHARARSAQRTERAKEDHPMIPTKDIDEIQAGWTDWKAVGVEPIRGADKAFHFDDHPDFTPNKSPEEMLREGCFGGSYFRPLRSRKLGVVVQNDWEELPIEWFQGLNVPKFLTSPEYNSDVNKYKVSCGQSIEEWEAAGWIRHEYDVRGWFQWYTRFFRGRRCEDDERQISRWKKCVGETGRWRRMLLKKYQQLGVREVFDDGADEDTLEVSPVMHQTCHHWAFEVRQEHLDAFWASGGK